MPPVANGGARARAGFEEHEGNVPNRELRGRSQANGTGADHRDG